MKKEEFLRVFRTVISEEIRNFTAPQPTWMRSSQVREMLNISDSTLQTFRINGTIPAYKLDNMWLYKYDEIIAVLEANRVGRKELSNE
ncbi:helix-turn-helix domain-containing protein [Aquipluma nitroreducens]|uniref:helix-turn-helix domain-containing protein n=1 Tax=Aquipluma nitroreducens TaxID=2010828 RepID=UPI00296F02FE|nr:helix-turn-helix domain-containing protein [Aquipluma nitroreducens]